MFLSFIRIKYPHIPYFVLRTFFWRYGALLQKSRAWERDGHWIKNESRKCD